jgi:hypothetical protein
VMPNSWTCVGKEGLRFAVDSPVEESGFEPLVPLAREALDLADILGGSGRFAGDLTLEESAFELLVPPCRVHDFAAKSP